MAIQSLRTSPSEQYAALFQLWTHLVAAKQPAVACTSSAMNALRTSAHANRASVFAHPQQLHPAVLPRPAARDFTPVNSPALTKMHRQPIPACLRNHSGCIPSQPQTWGPSILFRNLAGTADTQCTHRTAVQGCPSSLDDRQTSTQLGDTPAAQDHTVLLHAAPCCSHNAMLLLLLHSAGLLDPCLRTRGARMPAMHHPIRSSLVVVDLSHQKPGYCLNPSLLPPALKRLLISCSTQHNTPACVRQVTGSTTMRFDCDLVVGYCAGAQLWSPKDHPTECCRSHNIFFS
jgi:hypothetical protein